MSGVDRSDDPKRRAVEAFEAAFGRRPQWGAAAPGRVNLIGEHTDYNEGFVLPIAIDRECVAVGGLARGGRSRVVAVDLGLTAEADLGRALEVGEGADKVAAGSWFSYVAGVAAQFQRLAGARGLPNLDIAIASSVPLGGGLSSSAALEVAAATLLEQVTGAELQPSAKALLCQRAEHEFAGVPCGIMDQFVAVMGRAGHALLIDCRSQEATPIPMPASAEVSVVVFNSNVRHALAGGEYAARRMACESAVAVLGVTALRDVDPGRLESARERLSDVEYRRARHVTTENARTLAAAEALRTGDLTEMGRLMRESHESLKSDYEVSCPELDTLVAAACAQPGVFGARMTGGGFGGCIVALAEPGAVGPTVSAVQRGFREAYGGECGVLILRASDGASPLDRRDLA